MSKLISASNLEVGYLPKYKITRLPGKTIINIQGVADPAFGWSVPTLQQLHGMRFYVANPGGTVNELNGKLVPSSELVANKNDGTAPSIGFKWYTPDTTDYAIDASGIY